MSEREHDVVIVGGGPVGAALAIALSASDYDVLLLEARPGLGTASDGRTLAMSYGSRLILARLGAWKRVEPATPIHSIHISQRGGFGRALLTAEDAGLPALGYVIGHAKLHRAMGEVLASAQATLAAGASVDDLQFGADHVTIRFRRGDQEHFVHARLLVIADGGASLGKRAGASIKVRDYRQEAIVASVATSLPHGQRAYERFTTDGPVALLPFEDRYALVWTAAPAAATRISAMNDKCFLECLQAHFGDRAGRFLSVAGRARFPLALRYAANPVLPRSVLLGNAAQALHPIAGQGFNLGLRDAWDLADLIQRRDDRDPGSAACLAAYRSARRLDRLGGIAVTDSLVRIFSNDFAPLRAARGAGLALLDIAPPAKRAFMQRMIFGASFESGF
ncbi:MAG TPA: FAD-dependent oxidoreductase [Burkholderiales bacterium]|nr:FAD-dependent oxidoreductase [Burkholderiales bacterium]